MCVNRASNVWLHNRAASEISPSKSLTEALPAGGGFACIAVTGAF